MALLVNCANMLRTSSSVLAATAKLKLRPTFHRVLATVAAESRAEEVDVVIVGGGPAGLALATALGSSSALQNSLKITLVEAGDLTKVREWAMAPGAYSNRVSSITNASQGFLNDIGAWDHVEQSRTCPMEDMQVWDGISDARITFSASEMPLSLGPSTSSTSAQMARLTENLNLQRGLLRRLSTIPAVELADKVKVQSISREERESGGWPLVHLSDGRVLRARLLVGADGPNSPVRAYTGIQTYGWAYDTQAIVATLCHSPRSALQAPNTVAYQRFLPTGPIAFLPLSSTASSMVWSTKPHLARALMADSTILVKMINAAFRLPEVSLRFLYTAILEAQEAGKPLSSDALTELIAWRERAHCIDPHSAYASTTMSVGVPPDDADSLPPVVTDVQVGTVASFPLRFSHADAYIGEGAGARTVLVGDAAHTVHPLAGQGLNMGLGDVEALTRCIEAAVKHGGDIGSYTALLPYTSERYLENHKLMSVFDKLHKLYASTAEPVVYARSVGLEVLNEFDTIKAALMMSAGGHAKIDATAGWSVATDTVKRFAQGLDVARSVGGGLAAAVSAGIQGAIRQAAGGNR